MLSKSQDCPPNVGGRAQRRGYFPEKPYHLPLYEVERPSALLGETKVSFVATDAHLASASYFRRRISRWVNCYIISKDFAYSTDSHIICLTQISRISQKARRFARACRRSAECWQPDGTYER